MFLLFVNKGENIGIGQALNSFSGSFKMKFNFCSKLSPHPLFPSQKMLSCDTHPVAQVGGIGTLFNFSFLYPFYISSIGESYFLHLQKISKNLSFAIFLCCYHPDTSHTWLPPCLSQWFTDCLLCFCYYHLPCLFSRAVKASLKNTMSFPCLKASNCLDFKFLSMTVYALRDLASVPTQSTAHISLWFTLLSSHRHPCSSYPHIRAFTSFLGLKALIPDLCTAVSIFWAHCLDLRYTSLTIQNKDYQPGHFLTMLPLAFLTFILTWNSLVHLFRLSLFTYTTDSMKTRIFLTSLVQYCAWLSISLWHTHGIASSA